MKRRSSLNPGITVPREMLGEAHVDPAKTEVTVETHVFQGLLAPHVGAAI